MCFYLYKILKQSAKQTREDNTQKCCKKSNGNCNSKFFNTGFAEIYCADIKNCVTAGKNNTCTF